MVWSPQRYKKEGKEKGFSDKFLTEAIGQSESVLLSDHELPSILSLRHLSERVGVSYDQLRGYVERKDPFVYERFSIRKRSGGRRFIKIPEPTLMRVQKWIHQFVLTKIPVHKASYAFKKGGSINECAARHCGAQWLIKIDIADFFDSISEIQVFRLFKEVGYQPLVAFELARICTIGANSDYSPRGTYTQWRVHKCNDEIVTYNQKILGYTPQGAPTSPLISNLVMRKSDVTILDLATHYELTYTRYSDDMTFSTPDRAFSRVKAREFINESYKVLSSQGYRPQYRKTKIIPPGNRKIVLGLNVDSDEPRLQKHFRDNIRQHLYYLNKFGPSAHAIKREFDSIWGLKCHLKGLIDYARMVEHDLGSKYLTDFETIDWPV